MTDLKAITRGAALALAALVLVTGVALAAGRQDVWTARLSGKNEIPPVDSKAHGSATFRIVWGDSVGVAASGEDSLAIESIEYRLRVSNLYDVTGAHIHRGDETEEGGVIVNLRPTIGSGRATGQIANGIIHASDLTGSLTGLTLWDLYHLFLSGEAYVNVHTEDYPDGEIRGQVGARGGGGAGGNVD
jgi:hypothetical protein